MTNETAAAILRKFNNIPEINLQPSEWEAIGRAIEVLDPSPDLMCWCDACGNTHGIV